MKLMTVLRRIRGSEKRTAVPSNRLSEAADALAEQRGDAITHGDADAGEDAIGNIVAAANDALFVDRSNEDQVLKDSASGYRRST